MKSGFCTLVDWLLIFAPRSYVWSADCCFLPKIGDIIHLKRNLHFFAAIVFFSVSHVLWLLQDSENGVALFIHCSERCLFFWSLEFFLRSHIFCSISGCLPFLGSRDQTYVFSNLFKANSANRRSCYVESRELRKLMKWLSYWIFFMGPKLNHIDCRWYWLDQIIKESRQLLQPRKGFNTKTHFKPEGVIFDKDGTLVIFI